MQNVEEAKELSRGIFTKAFELFDVRRVRALCVQNLFSLPRIRCSLVTMKNGFSTVPSLLSLSSTKESAFIFAGFRRLITTYGNTKISSRRPLHKPKNKKKY